MKTPYAMPGCDNCHETGVTRGFGGGPCPCLVPCFYCDALVPWSPDWEEKPREPQCARCAAACQECGADPPTLCVVCGANCHESCSEKELHHEPDQRPMKALAQRGETP
jgi:hypothetical protein